MNVDPLNVVDLLAELISRPSLNPGDTDDPSLVGEERVAAFIDDHLQQRGFITERIPYEPGRDNVIARFNPADGRAPERVMMIEGHMDTVAVDGMVVPPFEATRRNGRVYGRGACDTKGPTAAALAAFTPRVLDAARASRRGLMYVAACAEEKGLLGSVALADAGLGADEAIILEPTELVPVIAHKSSLWFDIQIIGRACHGSEPENGVNAVEAGAELLRFLREDFRFSLDAPNALLGHNTYNVGKFQGGRAANIVPGSCAIEIDLRTIPGEDNQALQDQIRQFLNAMKSEGRVVDYLFKPAATPSFSTDPQSELVQRMERATRDVCGRSVEPVGTAWMSDASPLSKTCSEIAVFGPGSIRQAHTKDEYIEIAELERGVAVFEAIYLDFLCSG